MKTSAPPEAYILTGDFLCAHSPPINGVPKFLTPHVKIWAHLLLTVVYTLSFVLHEPDFFNQYS